MLVDISISVMLAAVTMLMAYLGVHLTLHPAESPAQKRWFKAGFFGCALTAICLVIWQGIRTSTTQSNLQNQLSALQNKLSHTHVRMDITSISVEDPALVGKPFPIEQIFEVTHKANFNVNYRNVGTSNSERTGIGGEVVLADKRLDLDAIFLDLERKYFKPGWTGNELVPQEVRFVTVSSEVVSADQINKIKLGQIGIFVFAITRFSDATGAYQQEMCNWLQPPSSTVWHGCGSHESEKRLAAPE